MKVFTTSFLLRNKPTLHVLEEILYMYKYVYVYAHVVSATPHLLQYMCLKVTLVAETISTTAPHSPTR